MAGGRKILKRAAEDRQVLLKDGQCIMQVVSLRGSNLIEVMDAQGETSLALFPAKFRKSVWIKIGSFVVVDESGREKALESGSKVASIVSQVLFYEQVCALKNSPEWPELFRSAVSNGYTHRDTSKSEEQEDNDSESESSDGDGLPPLEANTNRIKPFGLKSDNAVSGSGTD